MARLLILLTALQLVGVTVPAEVGRSSQVAPPHSVSVPAPPLPLAERPWAPLLQLRNVALQGRLDHQLRDDAHWRQLIEHGRLAVGVVDLRDLDDIQFAAVNGDQMFYAASLPKLAVLLTANAKLADGTIQETTRLDHDLVEMCRVSCNSAATRVIDTVGFAAIRATVTDPRYRLYDATGAGGLWVGKRYAASGPRYPDPVAGYTHAATVDQVCRFYYLLATGRLVNRERSANMLQALANSGLHHKFCYTLSQQGTHAKVYRKSGSWRTWHADSVLVWGDDGRRYILAALVEDPHGEQIVRDMLLAVEEVLSIPPCQNPVKVRGQRLMLDRGVQTKHI